MLLLRNSSIARNNPVVPTQEKVTESSFELLHTYTCAREDGAYNRVCIRMLEVCVRMFVCVYMCMSVCLSVCLYTHMCVCVCV